MRYALDEGGTAFVELGHGQVLTGLLKRIDRSARRVNVGSMADLQKLLGDLED
jgi:[acyl-carrier-protein] S-malonyltransferase